MKVSLPNICVKFCIISLQAYLTQKANEMRQEQEDEIKHLNEVSEISYFIYLFVYAKHFHRSNLDKFYLELRTFKQKLTVRKGGRYGKSFVHTDQVRLRDRYRLHEILLSVDLGQCRHL